MTHQMNYTKGILRLDQPTIQILEALPIGVFIRRDGKIVFMNRFLREITGSGINSVSLISPAAPEDQDYAPAVQFEMGSAPRCSIFKWLTSNGKEIHIAAHGIKIESADGPGFLYFLENLPAGKQDEKISAAEARLLDMVSDGVICTDLELKITSWYRGAERIFGYSAPEVMGKHLSMLYEKGENGLSQSQDSEFHEKREGFLFEAPCHARDGTRIWATFSISLINDEHGRPTGFVTTVQDITRRRQAQEALRQSEERYRTLVNAIPDYLYIVQIKADRVQTLFHGPQCLRITGYGPDDYYRDADLWFRMVHPEDRRRVLAFAQALNEGNEVPPIEHRIYHRDGSVRWVRNSASARIINTSPKEVLIHGIVAEIPGCIDQTNEYAVTEEIQTIIEKIAAACRELEVPTQTILGRAELLLQSIAQNDPQYQLISAIADQALRMGEINRKLFNLLGNRATVAANEKRIIELKTNSQ